MNSSLTAPSTAFFHSKKFGMITHVGKYVPIHDNSAAIMCHNGAAADRNSSFAWLFYAKERRNWMEQKLVAMCMIGEAAEVIYHLGAISYFRSWKLAMHSVKRK